MSLSQFSCSQSRSDGLMVAVGFNRLKPTATFDGSLRDLSEVVADASQPGVARSRLYQFPNRRAVLDDEQWAALVIEVGRIEWDAEVVIDRGRNVARRDGPFGDLAAIP